MKQQGDFSKLRFLTTKKDKISLIMLFVMTILSSLIETFGIGIIMPFITFASNPSLLLENQYGSMIYKFFGFSSTQTFMFAFSAGLIIFYLFRLVYNTFYNYLINLFAYRKYHDLAFKLFQKILRSNLLNFVNKNSDILRRGIITDAMSASHYIRNFLLLYSEIFTITFLYSILLIVSWKMTLVLTCILSFKVFLITQTISKIIKRKGEEKVKIEGGFLGLLSNSFGNFKIIKIKDAQSRLEEDFLDKGYNRARIEMTTQTLLELPKNLLESFGFVILIACVAYILYRYEDASAVLPIMSMYALALYKVLPSVNKILIYYNSMKVYSKSLEIVYEELKDIPQAEGNEEINFDKEIVLQNVSFSYIAHQPIIKNLNLKIAKGEKIAFVGPSGAGKSTLVDIITGFYQPSEGKILIDSIPLTQENIKSWRKKIGYIPQQIYLFDGNVAQNIAFGSEYDEQRIIKACKIAKIYDFLQENEGIYTKVGDGGIKLSGGQRQRIGIARAIYDNPEILVLDEATSALDNETEAQIMDEIYELSKDKTLLIIAHRLSTVQRCDRKIEICGKHSS
ncbi:ABC transporter ATP-binding protein [Helicobacter cholecystus]|uniref:ABC transporter ATP-binding protein n=1 Tax=Helicobacter cholecystus TaxID=45498 RepID=A0A3D8IUI5_9HELI|nr:ABC transporter ATP-binding protein [Helicobacter cholecystus]RDU68670.1 ABC transporter ATP-binding protein [Helicobacter cholecystus]